MVTGHRSDSVADPTGRVKSSYGGTFRRSPRQVLEQNSDSVADPIGAVKSVRGGTSDGVPPGWLDGLSTRPCVRLRIWVVNQMDYETWRRMVQEVCR